MSPRSAQAGLDTIRLVVALVAVVVLASGCSLAGELTATPRGRAGPTPSGAASATASATGSATVAPVATRSPSPSAAATPGSVTYTVRTGDTLYGIAASHGTTWQSIVYWNKDRYARLNPDDPSYDPSHIEIGWVLLVRPGVVVAYKPAPGATPQPTPEPTPTSPPSVAVAHGGGTGTLVALTFDMGGRVDPALDIMYWLIDHDVKATIFMTGATIDSANTDAGRKVLALIAGRRALFELGNHSYSHRDFRTLDDGEIALELRGMEQAVAARTTLSPRPLFRPPYGGYDARVLAAVGAAGYGRTILWDVDTIDWKPVSDGGPTAAQILAKVSANARPGSIVLFHLGGYNTLEALPGVLDALRSRGLQPVTIGELLGL